VAGRKVLVVDDEDDIREITKLTLELTGGWEVLDADRGAKALAIAREELPDVVLLDVMMPDMDGPTTLSHLKADPVTSHIPVILVTAKVQAGLAGGWGSLPVAGVIPKPFDPMTLSAEVDRLLAV
jgi:CheY-like chemotaxis protein